MLGIFLNKIENHTRDVFFGGGFDTYEPRAGIDLHDDRTVVLTQQVYTSDVKPNHLGGTDGCRPFLGCDSDQARRATAM